MENILENSTLIETGVSGRVDIISGEDNDVLKCSTLPLGLPPVLPSLTEELEKFITEPHSLPLHDLGKVQRFFDREPKPLSLLQTELSETNTILKIDRDLLTGEDLGFSEVSTTGVNETSKNSTSLCRAPGPASEATRGSSTNYPFWPGGMAEPNLDELALIGSVDFENFEVTPPGFECGVHFNVDKSSKMSSPTNITNLSELMDDFKFMSLTDDVEKEDVENESSTNDKEYDIKDELNQKDDVDESVLDVISHQSVLDISKVVKSVEKHSEWIEVIDVTKSVKDFYRKVPNMAHQWSFELDNFQKQAILRLENHESVFVAAHTSAGKTVVAEYAIAMSQKHMTRTIYTSPIKALSNQKFRDFSEKFDVGLLTGDVQLRSEASCLIMTTEILQSMLYKGSDIIRDLEWVIFDEVHYINDVERGVVWEEVLIMLPSHVNIILLSATVPNTVEFADWIGRTKKKKIYVISTQKRPVPLEHYLYTGSTGKSRNECFMLVDAHGNMLNEGYQAAMKAKKDRASKNQMGFGAKGVRTGGKAGQDKNVYITLIEYLKMKDLLPVVCFTLSRKRCDMNAEMLSSIDFTTAMEKDEIRQFISKCLSKLKGPDKKIPQVNKLKDLLLRGLAVHHSGILPILKEVVELLFHKGLVKMLFATETFAMGVNMPTRTVIFDNIRKHDGMQFRDLLPGEYIQMAGRAGRRGHDSTGTVIILCKIDVPEKSDLHRMMLGKPTKLESRFRITYGMILNLLRVRQLRVEDMMKRSFDEVASQRNYSTIQKKLDDKILSIQSSSDLECDVCKHDIKDFYKISCVYFELKNKLWFDDFSSYPSLSKFFSPGRVISIYCKYKDTSSLTLAVVVSNSSKSKGKNLIVFVLTEDMRSIHQGNERDETLNSIAFFGIPVMHQTLSLVKNTFYSYQNQAGHVIVDVSFEDIAYVTSKILKIDGEKIINCVKKRQMPRFREDPPCQNTMLAIRELSMLMKENTSLPSLSFVDAFGLKEINVVLECQSLESISCQLQNSFQCTKCFSFQSHFEQAFKRFCDEREIDNLKYQLSEDSLKHLQEYKSKLIVLNSLGYIDSTKTVEMKGRVACEMGNHELMITELVYNNVFTPLPPEEIAALLSCLIFQQKTENEPKLTESLEKGVLKIKEIATRIGEAQKDAGLLQPVGEFVDQFKFGLTEVVYQWAKGMSFDKITMLTDVQEGIIVKCIQRLDETLRDVKSAARIVGDPVLSAKMESASVCIRRDIVFAASLYTQ